MIHKTSTYRRHQRRTHIARKKDIIRTWDWEPKYDGMLSKGKIHCSCFMCAFHGPTISDLRKTIAMDQKIKEYKLSEYALSESD